MDWDKLRIFHDAAEAGSFTHAGETLGMSQSAVSRQVSALEKDLNVTLFHRHARGLNLTEQGELLYRTTHEVLNKLQTTKTMLADSKDKPFGDLRITTTVGFGAIWIAPRMPKFIELYPDINLRLLLSNEDLDLSMRQADAAVWMHEPKQNDLIRRRLFTVHFHIYASPAYLRRHGTPKDLSDLDDHNILIFGEDVPHALDGINWLVDAGRTAKQGPRTPTLQINSVYGLKLAVQAGTGLAFLPDYLVGTNDTSLVTVLPEAKLPSFDTYYVYPEELRNSKRINVFRDFLLARSRDWDY